LDKRPFYQMTRCASADHAHLEGGRSDMKLTSRVFVAAVVAATCALGSVSAQAQNVRVRGTIEKLDGNTLLVKSRDGAELKLTLKDGVRVAGVIKAALADVKTDSNVAITSRPRPDGTFEAVELRIAPAGQAFNSFHSEWDLMPNSFMTNGAMQQSVTSVDGQVLTVKYKVVGKADGENKIVVTPKTIIATTVAGTKDDLKPGLKVFVAGAPKLPDGSLDVAAIQVEKEIPPPQ
jgi:hypothetical protein